MWFKWEVWRASEKMTNLGPLQAVDSLMLSQAARVGAAAAGSCHSYARAGRYWCWLCSGFPAAVTAVTPECYRSPPRDDSFPCPHTVEWPWPTCQPLWGWGSFRGDLKCREKNLAHNHYFSQNNRFKKIYLWLTCTSWHSEISIYLLLNIALHSFFLRWITTTISL